MENKYKVMAIEKVVVKRFPEARKPHSVDYDEAKDFMFEFKADGEAYTSAVVPYICDWREYRQIYNFDPDLENELVSNFQKDFEYPIEFLFSLPCSVFVLKTKESEFIIRSVPEKRHFAIFDLQAQAEFLMDVEQEMKTFSYRSLVKSEGVSKETWDGCGGNTDGVVQNFLLLSKVKRNACRTVFPLVVYLSYVNADIKPYKPTTKRKAPVGAISQTIQENAVGLRIGSVLRKTNQMIKEINEEVEVEEQSGEKKPRKKMIAHVRRGHPHRYWCNAEDGSKKLVVRWVETTVVNGDIETATIHEVK